MKPSKPSKTVLAVALLATLLALGLALSSVTLTAPAQAFGPECGPCGGAQRTVTGRGSGSDCGEALDNAHDDAVLQAHQGAPACSPCQLTDGPLGCFVSGTTGQGATVYSGSWTLRYRCQTCNPGGPSGP